MSLLHPARSTAGAYAAPRLDTLDPQAAVPGGSFDIAGANLLPDGTEGTEVPEAFFGDERAALTMIRPGRAVIRVPDAAISSDLVFRAADGRFSSNVLRANIGVPIAEDLHMIANPCTDPDGNIYAMVSGSRGQRMPVSIYRIDRDFQMRAFARDLLNVSAVAFGPDDHLYASSRSDGAVYRISLDGTITTFAEGMGVATGIAFDRAGNLFVGDRSGTIFKISPEKEIFVFATLEPSVAAYHLCFRDDGTLLVAAPNTGSFQSIHAIDPEGNASIFFHGLGRPQGMAIDDAGNVYIAASCEGRRGIFRVQPGRPAKLIVSGNDLVGFCFIDDGCAAIASRDTLFHVDLGIQGKPLL